MTKWNSVLASSCSLVSSLVSEAMAWRRSSSVGWLDAVLNSALTVFSLPLRRLIWRPALVVGSAVFV